MFFEDLDGPSGGGQQGRAGESADARADDYNVDLFFLLFFFRGGCGGRHDVDGIVIISASTTAAFSWTKGCGGYSYYWASAMVAMANEGDAWR